MTDPNDVLIAWETSSQYWNKHQARIEEMFAPLTRALIESAQIAEGQKVLDIGGGSGQPSLTISTVVGETGLAVYTDPSSGMVKSASAESKKRKLRNMEFHECAAEHLPFPDNSFDVVVGRLSAMFFTDAKLAISEILRVAKPGGRLVFLVWSAREANPFFSVISDVLNRFVPAEDEDEDAPAAFRFARQGKLASLLREAGAVDVAEEKFNFQIEAPVTVDEFWELRTEMSDSFRSKLAQLSSDQVSAVKTQTIEAVKSFFQTGVMNFPAAALIVAATKPQATPS